MLMPFTQCFPVFVSFCWFLQANTRICHFFSNYARLVVKYFFSLPCLPNVICCMCWLLFKQGQENHKVGKVLFTRLNFTSYLCMFGYWLVFCIPNFSDVVQHGWNVLFLIDTIYCSSTCKVLIFLLLCMFSS